MLRWLLILAMALLPWHGWAGASLAAAPAAPGHQAVHANALSGAASHHEAGHASADCLDEAGPAADHHAAAGFDGGCPGCSMCHSCSPVGLPAIAAMPAAEAAPPQRPAGAVSRFASAERRPGLKPPIS